MAASPNHYLSTIVLDNWYEVFVQDPGNRVEEGSSLQHWASPSFSLGLVKVGHRTAYTHVKMFFFT